MRIYENCLAAVCDIGRELKKCSSNVHTQTYQNKDISDNPEFATKEIQGFSFAIIDANDRDKMPNLTLDWCKAELLERVSSEPVNPGTAYKLREDLWKDFQNTEGKFDYTYSERMHWQLSKVIKELKERPDTRQAIIEVHDRKIDQEGMGEKRIPCSMFYQFMYRDGKLDVIYVMRSSDFVTHFQNDIWLAMALRDYIADCIDIEPGKFIMFVSSLHTYKKDWEELKNY